MLNDVNNEVDSSDSENEEFHVTDDEGSELSFESDDEGNYQQNQNKKHSTSVDEDGEEEDVDDEEEDDEDIDDEDIDDGEEEEEDIDDGEEVGIEEEDEGDDDDVEDESDFSIEEDDEEDEAEDAKLDAKQKTNGLKSAEHKEHKADKKSTAESGPRTGKATKAIATKSTNEPNAVEKFRNELNRPESSKSKKASTSTEVDEYEQHDTDDEEDIRNTVGNIPMQWYDEYKHIGYDWDARKIIKPEKGDQLDDFLKRMEDPDFWRTVKDPQTGQDVILSEADIDLIKRINARKIPDASFNEYEVSILGFFFWLLKNYQRKQMLNKINFLHILHSHGSIGSHRKWKECQFAMYRTTSAHSFRPFPKRRKSPNWCTPSKWAGSRAATKWKSNGQRRDRNSICCGKPIRVKKICAVFTIMYRHRNVICLAMLNRTIHRPNICLTRRKCANGTSSKMNRHGANCTLSHTNTSHCAKYRPIHDTYVSGSCVVWTCICVHVHVAPN